MGEGTWPGTSELGRPGGYPRATRLLPLGRALSFPAWAGRTFGTALERHPVNLRPSTELPCLRALLGLGSTRPKSGPERCCHGLGRRRSRLSGPAAWPQKHP